MIYFLRQIAKEKKQTDPFHHYQPIVPDRKAQERPDCFCRVVIVLLEIGISPGKTLQEAEYLALDLIYEKILTVIYAVVYYHYHP